MKKLILAIAIMALLAAPSAMAATGQSNTVGLTINQLPLATINAAASEEAYENGAQGTGVIQLAVTAPGTSTGPNPTYLWTASAGVLSNPAIANPTVDITGVPAGTLTFSCVVTNDIGPMTSNNVTLEIYALPTVTIATNPVMTPNPPGPPDDLLEQNFGATVVYTATVAGGWGAVPNNTLTWVMSTDLGVTWVPVPNDAQHVLSTATVANDTLTIDPAAPIDTAWYRCDVDDNNP